MAAGSQPLNIHHISVFTYKTSMMNRFDSMTKEQYRAAKDGFFLQYNPPASKPVETMDLVMG